MCHINFAKFLNISLLSLAINLFAINEKINQIFQTRYATEPYQQTQLLTLRNMLHTSSFDTPKNQIAYMQSDNPLKLAKECARKRIMHFSQETQDNMAHDDNFSIAMLNSMIIDSITIDSYQHTQIHIAIMHNQHPETELINAIHALLNIKFNNDNDKIINSVRNTLTHTIEPGLKHNHKHKNAEIKEVIQNMILMLEQMNNNEPLPIAHNNIIYAIAGLTALEALYLHKNDIHDHNNCLKYSLIFAGTLFFIGFGILLYYLIYQPETPNNYSNLQYLTASTEQLANCLNRPFKESSKFGFANLANRLVSCSKNLFNLTLSNLDNATNIMSSSFLNNVLYKLLQDQTDLTQLKTSLLTLKNVKYNTSADTINTMLQSINNALLETNTTITSLNRIRNFVV